jgi:hypothetical protein
LYLHVKVLAIMVLVILQKFRPSFILLLLEFNPIFPFHEPLSFSYRHFLLPLPLVL